MGLKMNIEPLKLNPNPTSNIDFEKLNKDIELGKHTIRIIGCGLCNYNCKECFYGKL